MLVPLMTRLVLLQLLLLLLNQSRSRPNRVCRCFRANLFNSTIRTRLSLILPRWRTSAIRLPSMPTWAPSRSIGRKRLTISRGMFLWNVCGSCFLLFYLSSHPTLSCVCSVSDLDAVTEERNNARRKHEDLRRLRLEMFMDGFGEITLKLKEMYQMITLGGDAELELVDSLDPFSEGIVFSVRPPKKSWKNISNLSGGEKTLSSLALVFALHHFKPTPLYVMDEIDAALDFKNVSIVANYIKERTRNAQFIIISLRNNMFELADRLVGIYVSIIRCTCEGLSQHTYYSRHAPFSAFPWCRKRIIAPNPSRSTHGHLVRKVRARTDTLLP